MNKRFRINISNDNLIQKVLNARIKITIDFTSVDFPLLNEYYFAQFVYAAELCYNSLSQ